MNNYYVDYTPKASAPRCSVLGCFAGSDGYCVDCNQLVVGK